MAMAVQGNRRRQNPSVQAFNATASSTEEPFRVLAASIQVYKDPQLSIIDKDAVKIDQGSIVSAQYVSDDAIYIGEPYSVYASVEDMEPIDNGNNQQQGGQGGQGGQQDYGDDQAYEDENGYYDDQGNWISTGADANGGYVDENGQYVDPNGGVNGGGGNGGGDANYDANYDPNYDENYDPYNDPNNYDEAGNYYGPQYPATNDPNQEQEQYDANGYYYDTSGQPVNGGGGGQNGAYGNNAAMVDGMSYVDQTGKSHDIQYTEDEKLGQMLTTTDGMAHMGMTGGMGSEPQYDANEQQQYDLNAQAWNQQQQQHPQDVIRDDVSDGGRSHHSHASSHSHHSHHSQHSRHSSHHGSQKSGRHSDDSISVSTFHGVERRQAGDVEMQYVNDPQGGSYHAISKKDLKSPLIFNQIANDIRARRAKTPRGGRSEKVIDNILLTKFNDAVPIPGRNYFTQARGIRDGIVIGIHFHNEKAVELEATLCNIYDMVEFLRDNNEQWMDRPVNVLIIQDGWGKCHGSMQRYIKKLFPKMYYFNESAPKDFDNMSSVSDDEHKNYAASEAMTLPPVSKYWWEYHTDIDGYKDSQGPLTYIFEKTFDNPTYFQFKFPKNERGKSDKRIQSQAKLHITLIIKLDNRRKHNSQHWFFGKGGFADAYHARYLFTTHAFTLFDPACLYWLVAHLDTRGDCSAATGRQRAMTRGQQGKKATEFRCTFDYALRQAQAFDYEFNNVIFNPVYGAAGFLPGIPGPCGLYRCSDILTDEPRNWYLELLNKDATETGFIEANLRVAEDRILSYASVLKINEHRRMAYVPEALFFFRTMTNIEAFVESRRRWINGTYAGFIYLLISQPQLLSGWHASSTSKLRVWGLLMLNMFVLITQFLSPAISFSIMHSSLLYSLEFVAAEYITLTDSILLFAWVVWILHIVIHNTQDYNTMIMSLLYAISLSITVIIFVGLIMLLFQGQDIYLEMTTKSGLSSDVINFMTWILAFTVAMPFGCAYLVGGVPSCIILGKSIVLYLLLFHLLVPFFTSYAFARSWDVTVDDTPMHHLKLSEDEKKEREEDLELVRAKFLQFSRGVLFALVVFNVILYALPAEVKVVGFGLFLLATTIFIALSLTVLLLKQFCGDLYVSFCEEPAGYNPHAYEQQLQHQAELAQEAARRAAQGQGADDDDDDGVIVIPEVYEPQQMNNSHNPQQSGYGFQSHYQHDKYGNQIAPMHMNDNGSQYGGSQHGGGSQYGGSQHGGYQQSPNQYAGSQHGSQYGGSQHGGYQRAGQHPRQLDNQSVSQHSHASHHSAAYMGGPAMGMNGAPHGNMLR